MFWFPTPKILANLRITPQYRYETSGNWLNWRRKKPNSTDNAKSKGKFLKRFYWTETILTELEKQPVDNILVEYHNDFATHRRDIGMNKEFKVKLTTKQDKGVFS